MQLFDSPSNHAVFICYPFFALKNWFSPFLEFLSLFWHINQGRTKYNINTSKPIVGLCPTIVLFYSSHLLPKLQNLNLVCTSTTRIYKRMLRMCLLATYLVATWEKRVRKLLNFFFSSPKIYEHLSFKRLKKICYFCVFSIKIKVFKILNFCMKVSLWALYNLLWKNDI